MLTRIIKISGNKINTKLIRGVENKEEFYLLKREPVTKIIRNKTST